MEYEKLSIKELYELRDVLRKDFKDLNDKSKFYVNVYGVSFKIEDKETIKHLLLNLLATLHRDLTKHEESLKNLG